MKPPSSDGYDKIVFSLIAAHPGGIGLDALAIQTGMWVQPELVPCLKALEASGLIRRADGKLHIRQRKRKPEPRPTFWSRLAGLFR